MNILIHPTYFPTIAHFVAIVHAETVTFEAADNFQKQTFRNRMYVYGANGKLLLNIPVKHNKDKQKTLYKDIEIENVENWQKQHWRSIVSAYKSSPFFEYYEDDIKGIFTKPQTSLYSLNVEVFNILCECIEIEAPILYTDSFSNSTSQFDFRHLVNSKKETPIQLEQYTQVFGDKYGYLNNLSILDLLFNEGPNTLNYLESQAKFW
ncbi:MAG: WbqC family protein [Flavobacteriaceae bacterium]